MMNCANRRTAMTSGDDSHHQRPTRESDAIVKGPDGQPLAAHEVPAGGLAPGTRMGRYVVLETIGAGAMGVVLAAFDPELNRKVALKLMQTTPRDQRRERRGKMSRLLLEAQALAKLAHPNVITVYDVGTWDDRVFVAMELVEGDTLEGWLGATKRRWSDVLAVMLPAGRGLAAAHAAGLIHRDFKPDNVLIGDDGRVRVMDFGLAAPAPDTDTTDLNSLDLGGPALDRSSGDLRAPLLSQTGSMMGTPAYMAPEQHEREATDPRSDQYSFCVTLYRALYGVLPFDGADLDALVDQKLAQKVTEPAGAGVPGWLRRIVLRGLSPDRSERWPSMESLLTQLDNDPRVARRKWLTIGAAAVVASGSLAGVLYWRNQRPAACRGAEEDFAAVWNDDTRDAVTRGLVDAVSGQSKPGWAEHSATEITALVDDYGERWVTMSTDACEATHVRVEQSLRRLAQRQQCLDDRRSQVEALGQVLAEADLDVAIRAFDVAAALRPLAHCADPNTLAASVEPPQQPAAQRAVTELRQQLARVQILDAAGRHDDAHRLATDLFEQAQSTGYPPIEAEVRYELGLVEASRAKATAAERDLSEAHWKASSVKHDTVAAAAARALVDVVGLDLARRNEGLGWSRHAEAALKRIGLGDADEAALRWRVGAVHAANGGWAQAQTALERARALYDAERETRPANALAHARVLLTLAEVRRGQGRLDDAQALLDEAQQRLGALLGPEHPELSRLETAAGRLDDARARHGEARNHYDRAQAQLLATVGAEHPAIADVLRAQAASLSSTGDHSQAIAVAERAVALLRKARGDHPSVARARYELGDLRLAAGRREQARTDWDAALALWETTHGEDHPALAFPLTQLASLDLEDGHATLAVQRLERALKVRGRKGLAPTLLADTQFALARALHDSGEDRTRARELAHKAREVYEQAGAVGVPAVSAVDRWLAVVTADDPTPGGTP